MLTDLIAMSWSIRDLEAKVLKDGLETLDHFGGWVKVVDF